ncbi:RHS repeat domain-containing protein [Sphingobacterium anhuiense]|uniref:RHS repeat domain-containing protein n=1 Tax=Sphingobacterium anhuiense TaxID=493780 RepID=UPI003C2E16C5
MINRNKLAGGAADIVYYADYYPFGSEVRSGGTDSRYGYQGLYAEKDKETGWNNFELRNYDSAIGLWLTVDPYAQYHSPYVGMGNNPVSGVDANGGWSEGGGDPPNKNAWHVKMQEVVINGVKNAGNYLNSINWSKQLDNFVSGIPIHQYTKNVMGDLGQGHYMKAAAGMMNGIADGATLIYGIWGKSTQLVINQSLASSKQLATREATVAVQEVRITAGREVSKLGSKAAKSVARDASIADDLMSMNNAPERVLDCSDIASIFNRTNEGGYILELTPKIGKRIKGLEYGT